MLELENSKSELAGSGQYGAVPPVLGLIQQTGNASLQAIDGANPSAPPAWPLDRSREEQITAASANAPWLCDGTVVTISGTREVL
jgi:hypothetical protein